MKSGINRKTSSYRFLSQLSTCIGHLYLEVCQSLQARPKTKLSFTVLDVTWRRNLMSKGFGIFNCLNYLQFPTLLVSLLLTVQDCLGAKRGKDQGALFTFESISFLFRFCSSMNFCFSWNISSLLVDASVVFLGSSLTPSSFCPGFFSSVIPFMAFSVPRSVFSSGRGGRKGPLVSLATSTSHLGAKLTLFRLGLAQKSCFLLSTKATKKHKHKKLTSTLAWQGVNCAQETMICMYYQLIVIDLGLLHGLQWFIISCTS